ncbi:MAG TPA: zinc-binding alcohol dehydrogenase family protein [Saprospiraceae bacterium]|nr:zinc-binding alcohol dehydrogenase family protein [Saprospiraceae bacterium]
MKALICTRPGQFDYVDKAEPTLNSGQSLIKIRRVGVCGTDLHAFEGTQPYFSYPRILGHEIAAEFVTSRDPSDFTEGEALTFIPYFHCGQCIACRTDRPNCCVNMQVCGVHIDGGMAEYLSVPSSSLLKGQGLALDTLALVEPLAIGAHGVRRAAIQNGEFVLVVGAGPIGLGTMAFARLSGGNVIALDLNEQRLQFCRNKLNIQHTLNAMDTKVLEKIRTITKGDMPTVVIDATGSQKAINHSFQYMAHGARYVLIGLQKGDITFSHPEFHKREGSLMSSRNATRQDFERVISVLKNNTINPGTFITHRTTFNRVGQEFSNWLNPENGVVKAMIEFH